MSASSPGADRFRVEGNRLVVTAQFDPRFQRESEGELLATLQGLLEEQSDTTVYLDLYSRPSFPSMLVGVVVESLRRAREADKRLVIRIQPKHLKNLDWGGVDTLFREVGRQTDPQGVEFVEFEGV